MSKTEIRAFADIMNAKYYNGGLKIYNRVRAAQWIKQLDKC